MVDRLPTFSVIEGWHEKHKTIYSVYVSSKQKFQTDDNQIDLMERLLGLAVTVVLEQDQSGL
jgi:fatty-acid desaturase